MNKFEEIKILLEKYGQQHLLMFYNELNEENKLKFNELEERYRAYRRNFVKK